VSRGEHTHMADTGQCVNTCVSDHGRCTARCDSPVAIRSTSGISGP
jgi:hypothetical protein